MHASGCVGARCDWRMQKHAPLISSLALALLPTDKLFGMHMDCWTTGLFSKVLPAARLAWSDIVSKPVLSYSGKIATKWERLNDRTRVRILLPLAKILKSQKPAGPF